MEHRLILHSPDTFIMVMTICGLPDESLFMGAFLTLHCVGETSRSSRLFIFDSLFAFLASSLENYKASNNCLFAHSCCLRAACARGSCLFSYFLQINGHLLYRSI
jgi:hypothetical protein